MHICMTDEKKKNKVQSFHVSIQLKEKGGKKILVNEILEMAKSR
jgi:hypothetical protein